MSADDGIEVTIERISEYSNDSGRVIMVGVISYNGRNISRHILSYFTSKFGSE